MPKFGKHFTTTCSDVINSSKKKLEIIVYWLWGQHSEATNLTPTLSLLPSLLEFTKKNIRGSASSFPVQNDMIFNMRFCIKTYTNTKTHCSMLYYSFSFSWGHNYHIYHSLKKYMNVFQYLSWLIFMTAFWVLIKSGHIAQ